jgi:DNA oxidative demethylase
MRGTEERPDGLVSRPGVVSAAEEQSLLAAIRDLDLEAVVMRGQTARRTVRHFGYTYSFDSGELVPTDPIPDYLTDVRARCAELAGVDPLLFAQALVTRYPPGATIGWHRDAPVFGRVIAGLSLRSDCVMRFQRRAAGGERRVFELPLAPQSGYVLAGAARWVWQHSIPAVAQERYSITFRTLKAASTS